MEASPVFHSHPTEARWEEYCFGRLNGQEVSTLEEHLLVCESCQMALEEVTEHIRLMKAGTARFATTPPQRVARGWRQLPLFWMTGLALASVAFFLPRGSAPRASRSILPPASVQLTSFRGDDQDASNAPARRPLDLSINVADVPTAPEYRLTVVTSSGKQVWAGTPKATGGTLAVHLAEGLDAGPYWVRLYARESQMLAEYALLLQ